MQQARKRGRRATFLGQCCWIVAFALVSSAFAQKPYSARPFERIDGAGAELCASGNEMPKQPKPLPAMLTAWRTRQRCSQSQAARALGVSVKTLQNWEQGRRTPRGFALRPARAPDISSGKSCQDSCL